jgi:murein DD-endopeptidase MepM/ murein hydrolase activator NlpD
LALRGCPPARSGRANRILALSVAAFSCAGGVASAAGGGLSAAGLPAPPEIQDLSCLDRCAAARSAMHGATVAFTGKSLGEVRNINFAGENGPVTAKPSEVTKRRIEARVPEGATSGKPRVADRYGQRAKSPVPLEVVDESNLPGGGGGTDEISVTPATTFFDSQQPITLTYLYKGGSAGDVRIELVNRITGEVARTWVQEGVQPGSYQTLEWDGLLEDGQTSAPTGDYKFRVGPNGGTLEDGGAGSYISIYDHKFPIRGKHTYGDGVGAPRSGHTHQGQDVFAKCGTTLVAARGGKVDFAGYHSSAGNYAVIDGRGTGRDYVYMHMQDRPLVAEGDRVYTGQQIGAVGESGNASGCHLHFELWSAPGWYEGGDFLASVTKELKKWDSWS